MQIRNSRVLLLHAVFQILGVIAQVHFLAKYFSQHWESKHKINGLVVWAGRSKPPKIEIMLEYGLLLTIVAAAILILFTYAQRNKQHIEINRSGFAILGAYELVCLISSFNLVWVFISALLPVWIYSLGSPMPSVARERIRLTFIFSVIVGSLLVSLGTSWRSAVYIVNYYFDLAEYTRMDDGRIIENSEYLSKHFPGRYFNIEQREDIQEKYTSEICLHLNNSVFRSAEDPFLIFPPGMGIFYDWEKENLVIKQIVTNEQQILIESLWGVKISGFEKIVDKKLYADSDEEEFLQKNIGLINKHKFMGDDLDNHSRLYLPSLSGTAQEPDGNLSIYGAGLTIALASLLRITGSSTFNDYVAICWCAAYAYLLMLTLVIWYLTRNLWAAAIVLISPVIFHSFDAMRSTPELNPILHFPDLICLMLVAYDLQRGTVRSAFIRALSIGLMIWWNQEFGLAILISSIVWHLFEASSDERVWRKLIMKLGLEILIAAIVFFGMKLVLVINQIDNKSLIIDSIIANWRQLIFLISLTGTLIWMRFIKKLSHPQPKNYILDVAGISAIYAVIVNIFVLPGNTEADQLSLVVFAIIPSMTIFTLLFNKMPNGKAVASHFIFYTTIIFVGIQSANYYATYCQIQYGKESHKKFVWDFPGLTATSYVDPEEMQKSVNLIAKYQPEGRLQIISKYDNWFRILMRRPNPYVYIDWRSALASYDSVNITAEHINQSIIPILFVDNKLLASCGNADNGNTEKSNVTMQLLLRKILKCYTPGEVGGLLQVWYKSSETNCECKN